MFSFFKKFISVRSLAVGTVALAASQAHAGLTAVQPTPHTTEGTIQQIFSHQYGGTFAAVGTGFTNGTITATRVDDQGDSVWTGNLLSLNAVASFSRSEQSLGLLAGKTGGGFEQLFTVNQFGYLPAMSASVDHTGQFFRFALDNGVTTLRSSSLSTENTVGDQLITYRIDGLGGGTSRYMLFWEDTPTNFSASDQDYNDMVLEATFAGTGGPVAVPLPPAAWAGLMVMGGMAAASYFKKRKMQTA